MILSSPVYNDEDRTRIRKRMQDGTQERLFDTLTAQSTQNRLTDRTKRDLPPANSRYGITLRVTPISSLKFVASPHNPGCEWDVVWLTVIHREKVHHGPQQYRHVVRTKGGQKLHRTLIKAVGARAAVSAVPLDWEMVADREMLIVEENTVISLGRYPANSQGSKGHY